MATHPKSSSQPGNRPGPHQGRSAHGHGRPGPHGGGAPQGNHNPTMLHAPYNFVPLSGWVHTPEWNRAVSHDLPFQDGYSGTLHLTLRNHTPLLVGGEQRKASNDRAGQVSPFKLPDDRYAIPGSGLKGMLRAVVEIAAFGRMRMVDEQRPSLRDISKADSIYAMRVRGKVKAGWLRKTEDGGRDIQPCAFVHLPHGEIETYLGRKDALFSKGQSVRRKYETWRQECQNRSLKDHDLRFNITQHKDGKIVKNVAQLTELGEKAGGFPVFTGQISDSRHPNGKGKKHDFLFHSPDPDRRIAVDDSVWRDFLKVHGEDEKRDAQSMSWPGYWKAKFWQGKDVPVFYLDDSKVLRIGLAFMPKLAGDFSTHNLICHASPAHLDPPGLDKGYDFADLLFGAINEADDDRAQHDALRARVSCGLLLAQGQPEVSEQPATILNGPKPSYFPSYITQPKAKPQDWNVGGANNYATYIATSGNGAPTLRGFKRYPVRPAEKAEAQPLTPDQQDNKAVQIVLHTLGPGAEFTGRIVFHNLKRVELGALLWAVTWGGDAKLRHALGMGKPFGFGQASLTLDHVGSRLIPNDPQQPPHALDRAVCKDLMDDFEKHMETARPDWKNSPQLHNLLAMANPQAAEQAEKEHRGFLTHMTLDSGKDNEFQQAKQKALALPDYAMLTGRMAYAPPLRGKPCQRAPSAASAVAPPGRAVSPPPAPVHQPQSETWLGCFVRYLPNSGEVQISHSKGTASARLGALSLDEALKERLKKKKELRNMTVETGRMGNSVTIMSMREASS